MNEEKNTLSQNEKILSGLGYFGFSFVLPLSIRSDSDFCRFHGKQALMMNISFFLGTNFIYIFSHFTKGFYSFLLFIWLFSMMFMSFIAFGGSRTKIPFISAVAAKLQIFPDEVIQTQNTEVATQNNQTETGQPAEQAQAQVQAQAAQGQEQAQMQNQVAENPDAANTNPPQS